jgi:hypothetical protein
LGFDGKVSDEELDLLLTLIGVVPCENRSLKLHQILSRLFDEMPPSIQEVVQLSKETSK